MVVTMAGVIHFGDHHLLAGLHRIAAAHLETIGAGTCGCWRCEQLLAAHQTHRILREAKGLLQVVFHHLVVMELQIGGHQIGALNTHQQQALATGFAADQQALIGVLHAEPFARAEIEEIEFLGLRVEILDPLLHAVLMGAQINGARITRAKVLLPGQHRTDVLAQVLIANRNKICLGEIRPVHPFQDDVITGAPGAGDDRCAISQLAQDQAMN